MSEDPLDGLDKAIKGLKKPLEQVRGFDKFMKDVDSSFGNVDHVFQGFDETIAPPPIFGTKDPTLPELQESDYQMIQAIQVEITDMQSLVGSAIAAIEGGDYAAGKNWLGQAAQRTTCKVCMDKLRRYMIDLDHTAQVCDLQRIGDDCDEKQTAVVEQLRIMRETFIPQAAQIHHERHAAGEVDHADAPTPLKSEEE